MNFTLWIDKYKIDKSNLKKVLKGKNVEESLQEIQNLIDERRDIIYQLNVLEVNPDGKKHFWEENKIKLSASYTNEYHKEPEPIIIPTYVQIRLIEDWIKFLLDRLKYIENVINKYELRKI